MTNFPSWLKNEYTTWSIPICYNRQKHTKYCLDGTYKQGVAFEVDQLQRVPL